MNATAIRTALVTAAGALAVVAATQLFPGSVPIGVVALGAVLGTGTGLGAVGIVLTYRTSRVINFGFGAMGIVGAGAAAGAANRFDVPWPVALSLGVAAGAALGAGFELAVVRRLARAPRLVLTVATIGLAQALPGLTPYVLEWFEIPEILSRIDTPWDHIEVTVDPVNFNGNDLAMLAIVPVVLVALTWFLLRTDAGTAVRGMADNLDRARLLGIPVGRLSLIVWALAGAIAALAVSLRVPNDGITFDPTGGPSALLPPLAAAVLTGLTSPTRAFVAGVALGVVDQVVRWNVDRQATTTLVLLGVIVVGLLAQRMIATAAGRRGTGVRGDDGGWAATAGRRLPRPLARLPEVRAVRWLLVAAAAAVALAIPALGTSSQVNYATVTLVYAMVAVSLVVLTGWGGVVSLGQIAVVGVGGVTAANLIADHNLDLFVTLAGSALAGGLVALLIGLPALRVSGQFLAVTTLAFAVAMQLYVLNPANNESLLPAAYARPELWGRAELSDERWLYLLALGVLVACLAVVRNLRRARTGRVIAAGRDNERAAAAAGVNTVEARLVAFLFAGVIAGLAGAIHAIALRGVGFNTYPAVDSLLVFSMAVIGGVASLGGALAGVVLVQGIGYASPRLELLVAGAGLLVVLLVLPGGLAQAAEAVRDRLARWGARRRGLPPVDVLELVDESQPAVVNGAEPSGTGPSGAVPTAAGPGNGHDGDRHDGHDGLGDGREADGRAALLACSGLEASYGSLQVLFGVDAQVASGDMLALLGTNGAGKSTVLRTIAGLLPARGGRVTFDGEDITGLPAEAIARRGLSLVPGGAGVFAGLTVAANLRLACWMLRRDPAAAARARDEVLELFPVLRARSDVLAGNLSGGEQQQLSLAMAFVTRPKLLCIDELSLGLAPTIVAQLVDTVRAMHARGTTIVVVEQSVDVALLLCERAVFLEKGQVRFRGRTAGLLDRPDILRAVFIGGDRGRPGAAALSAPAAPAAPAVPGTVAGPGGGDHGAAGERVRGLRLECRELVKRFGGIRAVDGVDLTIEAGAVVGLIGHNGAGKTTLFDLLTGFLPADGGRVLLGGADITRLPPHRRARRALGRSFQEARLFPSLTVADALRVGLERHLESREPVAAALRLPASVDSERAATRRVEELIELLGLDAYRDRLTGELSTGTRRIVELGVLLAQDPAVVLLDEPSAGVAQREAEALAPLLRRVQAETGCSMVVIEHDIALLAAICDELVALEQGAVIAQGRPDDVLADARVVTSYLGANPEVVRT